MKSFQKLRPAFTMVELLFVIVVLGIVASLGSEMIAKVYKSYILQRALHRAEVKTELAALQIANRLQAAIPGTVYRKRRDTSTGTEDWVEEITSTLGHPLQSDQYNVLQWVGADLDSFNAASVPGWSGFVDLNRSDANGTSTTLYTPGSDLNLTQRIVTNLNGGTFPAAWKTALYFPYQEGNASYVQSNPLSGNSLVITSDVGGTTKAKTIAEHYKFAWTSYALVVEKSDINASTGDLYLYYGFDPIPRWPIPNGTKRSLLLKNVSIFRFRGDGRTIRFKICANERISEDYNVTACKEKAVF